MEEEWVGTSALGQIDLPLDLSTPTSMLITFINLEY